MKGTAVDSEDLARALGADPEADLLMVARQTALVADGVRAWKAAQDIYDAQRAEKTAFERLTMLDIIRFVKGGLDVEADRLERLLGEQET